MRRRRFDAGSRGAGQRGFALIAILALAAMLSAFLIASALNRSSTDVSNEREDRSMGALRRAKAALINYAASEQWQAYKGQATNQPGGLPCPDTDADTNVANTGVSPGICSSGASRVGRFPFATIGADDLRDASGERLWYAVSSNFYKNSANKINSDTQGLLTVTGTAPAGNVVAIVFAPGPAIQDSTLPGQIQNRGGAANYNRIASYLENYTTGTDYTFSSNAIPTGTFNDRLLTITQAELMAAVEPVVTARIERDIAPRVQDYYNKWGAYPFPVPFDPTATPQSAYKGSTAQTRGLLPVTRSAPLQWQTASISVAQIAGSSGPSPKVTAIDCSSSSSSQINCRVDYGSDSQDRPAIQVQATLLNAALSFPDVLSPDDASMTDINGDPLNMTSPGFGQWSAAGSPQYTPTVTSVALSSGNGQVTFKGRLQNPESPSTGTGGRVRIRINVPAYLPFTDGTDPTYGWFVANEWYRQTYFAVSQGFLPGNGSSCTLLPSPPLPPTPPYLCLRVNNLRPSYATPNDKRAILVLAGRRLNGTARPTTTPADYFESANLTAVTGTAPFVYENRIGNPTSINDRVVVISP